MQKGVNTRLIVYEILFSLKYKKNNFDYLLNLYDTRYSLSLRDKKMIQNIVLSSMRYSIYIDNIIRNYVNKKITKNQKILFLGSITQLIFLDFKNYAVINSTVELAKNRKINVNPGFINAVLKKITQDKILLKNTTPNYKDLPKWFCGQTTDKKEIEKNNFLRTIVQKPSLHIVFKKSDLLKKFRYDKIPTSESSSIIKNASQIKDIPGYYEGNWWVQDYSSMLPISLMKNIKNKKIIDLCAAPGGKSFQLLSKEAKLDMIEINEKRADILKLNLRRLNFKDTVNIKDACKIKTNIKYDLVIIDAPCSAVGTIRRNPEIFFRNSPPDLKSITNLQKELLNKGREITKKNGVIIYMVCSFLNSETTNQVQKFLEKNKNFKIDKFHLERDEWDIIDKNGFINTMPKNNKNYNIDGFFAARLKNND